MSFSKKQELRRQAELLEAEKAKKEISLQQTEKKIAKEVHFLIESGWIEKLPKEKRKSLIETVSEIDGAEEYIREMIEASVEGSE